VSNWKSAGADLDTLFMARVSAAGSNVNLKNAGTDLVQIYEPRGSTTARANVNIKSAGVDLAQIFRDIGAHTFVDFADRTVSASGTSGQTRTAGYTLQAAGNIFVNNGTGSVDSGVDWISPTSAAASYSCKATAVSGTVSSGTIGSVLALTSDRTWTVVQGPTTGTKQAVIDIQIIRNSDSAVMKTARITLNADITP